MLVHTAVFFSFFNNSQRVKEVRFSFILTAYNIKKINLPSVWVFIVEIFSKAKDNRIVSFLKIFNLVFFSCLPSLVISVSSCTSIVGLCSLLYEFIEIYP